MIRAVGVCAIGGNLHIIFRYLYIVGLLKSHTLANSVTVIVPFA